MVFIGNEMCAIQAHGLECSSSGQEVPKMKCLWNSKHCLPTCKWWLWNLKFGLWPSAMFLMHYGVPASCTRKWRPPYRRPLPSFFSSLVRGCKSVTVWLFVVSDSCRLIAGGTPKQRSYASLVLSQFPYVSAHSIHHSIHTLYKGSFSASFRCV